MKQLRTKKGLHLIPFLVAVTIGPLASASMAQNYPQGSPGEAPLASPTGGKPVAVDPAEVRRDNTAGPGSTASTTGSKSQPVDRAELKRDNTANPGSLPSAQR